MKKIVFVLTILLFAVGSFSQTPSSSLLSKDYFLQKSKNQKKVGWILLGSGIAIAAAGGIVQLEHEKTRAGGFDFDFTGVWIAIAGGVVGLSSIPFFISSAKNKRKAASIAFGNQPIFLPQQNRFPLKNTANFYFKNEVIKHRKKTLPWHSPIAIPIKAASPIKAAISLILYLI